MTAPRTCIPLLLALCVACGEPAPDERGAAGAAPQDSAPRPAAPAAPRAPVSAPHARDAWLLETLAAARHDRAGLIGEVGAPRRAIRHPLPNRHDPAVTDTLVELVYDDARFVYYVVTAGGGELLDFAEVRADRHLLLTPPGIGAPADSLRAWWGAPVAATDSTVEYDCSACEVPHPATFVLRDGAVRAIRFDLYVD
ncbi:MAG TPA: hypothetical protein VF039_04705 [Longimicrobiales bacterium]